MRLSVILKRIFLTGAGLIVVVMCLLAAYLSEIGPFGHDIMYVPDYPGAKDQAVLVQQDPAQMDFFANEPYKVVTFTTTDKPDQVFAFFKDKLLHRPFEDWRSYMIEQGPASFRIYGFGRRQVSAPMYTFLATTEQKDGLTHIRVERYFFAGM
jgi:hypothetical protein